MLHVCTCVYVYYKLISNFFVFRQALSGEKGCGRQRIAFFCNDGYICEYVTVSMCVPSHLEQPMTSEKSH